MRVLAILLLGAAGCGRLGFTPVGERVDASPDADLDAPDVANLAPVADAGGDQTIAFVPGGTPISLDPRRSRDPDGTLAGCRIMWDSGSSSAGSCTVTYGSLVYLPGIYPVTLIVTDDEGASSMIGATITVVAACCGVPADVTIATLDAGPDQMATVGSTTTFDFSRSWNPDGASYREFDWDFGDGSAAGSTALTSTHVFTAPGRFAVTYRLANFAIAITTWPTDTVVVEAM